jgi:predicted MFS family arabinose efflux permease
MRGLLAAIAFTRMVINTGFRMVYPFLPALARGLGVEPQAVILAVTARSGLGLASPVLGSLGDLRDRRQAILLGVGIFVLGLLPVVIWPSFPTFVGAVLATGLAKIVLDPAQWAYLGDEIAFERRGVPLAVVELSWSASFLIGVPVVGLLIASSGWQAPFPILAVLALVGGIWLSRMIPRGSQRRHRNHSLRANLAAIRSRRSAMAALGVGLLIAAANEVVSIVYGIWMEDAFGLQVAALGAASAVIGLSELAGEGLVAGLSDRLGKRRSIAIGLLLSALALLALPVLAVSVAGALAGLFLMYLTFEFTIVGTIPLMTEQVPEARSTLLATNVGSFSLGRSLGALAGGPLFALGIQANALVAAGLNLVALWILLGFVQERGESIVAE